MNLRTVTCTGADDNTDLDDLAALSQEYPFIEWGLMLSTTRTGIDSRYPSPAQLEKISALHVNTSIHLNDRLAIDVAENRGNALELPLQLIRGSKRIQVNLFADIDRYPNLFFQTCNEARRLNVQMIIQAYDFHVPAVEIARNSQHNGDVVFLHDASGGRGIAGSFQKPVNSDFVGFAGGIRPENVLEKLEQIEDLGFGNPFWIDLESGIRTENVFDLEKVERLLRIVKPFVRMDIPPTR